MVTDWYGCSAKRRVIASTVSMVSSASRVWKLWIPCRMYLRVTVTLRGMVVCVYVCVCVCADGWMGGE